jgi:two-component system response regulator CpxR
MTGKTILFVDDDIELAQMLGEFLIAEGFLFLHASHGVQALDFVADRPIDLIVLDVMMPDLDGFEVLARLRRDVAVPVLMLTARGEADDRVHGLELGADDYLSKPFNPRELAARIRAILRRADNGTSAPPRSPLKLGPLSLDPADLSVFVDARSVRLTSAEFLLLEALARSAGQMHSRAQLTQIALGRELEAFDRSVDTHVSNLRRKLGLAAGSALEIRSMRGAGYLLTCRSNGS